MRKDKIMEFSKFGILAVFFCFVPSLMMPQSNYYVATDGNDDTVSALTDDSESCGHRGLCSVCEGRCL